MYALTCIDQYIRLLRGPPNRPTYNKSGLLEPCLVFLNDKRGELVRVIERNKVNASMEVFREERKENNGGSNNVSITMDVFLEEEEEEKKTEEIRPAS